MLHVLSSEDPSSKSSDKYTTLNNHRSEERTTDAGERNSRKQVLGGRKGTSREGFPLGKEKEE